MMMRILPLLALCACASLPEITRCDNTGEVIDPEFVAVGNDDLMNVSMRYEGCEPFAFRLCGIGDDWLTADGATLGVWHDGTQGGCLNTFTEDRTLNLRPLRKLYEDRFEVESADLELEIGTHVVDYSFAPEE